MSAHMADPLESTESEEPKAVEIAADDTEAFVSPPSSAEKPADSPPSPPAGEVDPGSIMVATRLPVHRALGAGKPADVLLWRNKKASAAVLGGTTTIWVFFEVLEYHLLPFLCYILILVVALLFLWSKTHIFIYKSPPRLPEVRIKEEPFLQIASTARMEINRAIAILRGIASGRDAKKFLAAVVGLWVLSVIGSWYNFLTLFYLVIVVLHTVPVIYEKYEGKIDTYVEKIVVESKKKYAVINEKVARKIPKGPLSDKKE